MKKTLAQIAAELRVKAAKQKYVSRGGLKLEEALRFFKIDPKNQTCIDVGASTGGFTDCLLQHGAKKVFCVDVGYGQLAWKLRQNPKAVVLDRQNIRELKKEQITEPIGLVTVDVSFVSLKKVFPVLKPFLAPKAQIIALIKPQFEVPKSQVGPGGIVTDPKRHETVVEQIREAGLKEEWICKGIVPSPITGADGNREFLILFCVP